MKRRRRRRRGVARRRGAAAQTGGGAAGKPSQGAGRGAGAAVEIEDGGIVDAIAASIRAGGIPRASPRDDGDGSGAADGEESAGAAGDSESSSAGDDLFTERIRGLIDMHREARALTAEWAESREPGAGERSARFAIEGVRSMVQHKMAELSGRATPASLDELECLSRALQRIEVADRYCSERERAAAEAESAVHPAERKPPLSTEELRAKLYPAIMEQFNIKRLGTQPWEPWPDDAPPAEPDADSPPPEPSSDAAADHSAWDESEAQSEAEAWTAHGSEEAREERGPVETQEARDEERVHREHDKRNTRRARDEVRPRVPLASERLRNAGGPGSTWAALSDFY